MNSVLKETIKLLVLSIGVSFLFYGLTSFSFIYVFVYFLSILVVPYWIKCEKLHWGIKVLSVVVVFLISSLTMIFSVNGVYRDNLNFYFVLYAIVVGFSLIHCKKRKVECKK